MKSKAYRYDAISYFRFTHKYMLLDGIMSQALEISK